MCQRAKINSSTDFSTSLNRAIADVQKTIPSSKDIEILKECRYFVNTDFYAWRKQYEMSLMDELPNNKLEVDTPSDVAMYVFSLKTGKCQCVTFNGWVHSEYPEYHFQEKHSHFMEICFPQCGESSSDDLNIRQ